METDALKHTEEREYYRINDTIEVSHFVIPDHIALADISAEQIQSQLFDKQGAQHFTMMEEFHAIDNKMNKLLGELKQDQAKIRDCFKLSNQKLQLLMNNMFNKQQRPTQIVNISAGGAAFQAAEDLVEGARIKLKLILHPSLQGFICSARIVLCRYLPKKDSDLPYRWSVKFIDMTAADEQILQKHIMRQQAERLRPK